MNAYERWKTHDRLRRITDPNGPCRTSRNGQLEFVECDAGLDGNTVSHVRMRLKLHDRCKPPGLRACCEGRFRVRLYTIPAKDLHVPEWARVDIRFGGVLS